MHRRHGSRADLEQALAQHGLRLRGGFLPTVGDALPALPNGQRAAVLWLAGQVGSACWAAFAASPFHRDGLPDPMDRWSKSIGDALARQFGGVALFPSDGPPYHPFQDWGRRCEPLQASPLMLQIHPEFGLWHAYRFALVSPLLEPGDLSALAAPVVPDAEICSRCDGQPCLRACPVQAFTGDAYRVEACAAHLHQPQGQECIGKGCQARRACPVGVDYRYGPEHAAFHMRAFAGKH